MNIDQDNTTDFSFEDTRSNSTKSAIDLES